MRHLALVAMLLLAGCAAPAAEPADTAAPSGPTAREPTLLALPATTVSSGAEPMILASRDGSLYVGDTSGLRRSVDGGTTWQRVSTPFVGGFFSDGFALAEDDAGTLYVAVTNGHLVSLAAREAGSSTWQTNHLVDASIIADRPWVAARGNGEVAVLYYDTKLLREACLHSTDGGRTFLTRYVGVAASPNAGNAVFGPDGALYYSVDTLGYRWDTPCVGEPKRLLHGAAPGATVFTQIAVSEDGDVHVAGPSGDNGQMRLVSRAAAGGTWRTLVVSAPEARSNTFATLSVQGDEVAVAWYASTTAGDPSNPSFAGEWHVHVARVADPLGSPTIRRDVVTSVPNHVGDLCMSGIGCTNGDRDLLDYFWIDHAADGSAHVAYGHDGTGSQAQVRHARLAP